MRRIILPFFFGIIVLTFQTTLLASLPIQRIRPDMILILTLYLSFSCPPIFGGILALFMGYLVDLFSGNSFGLYTFSRPLIFYAAKLFKDRFYLEGIRAQILFVFIFSLGEGLLILILLRILNPGPIPNLFPLLFTFLLPQSLVSGFVAPILFLLFDKGSLLVLGHARIGTEERE